MRVVLDPAEALGRDRRTTFIHLGIASASAGIGCTIAFQEKAYRVTSTTWS